MTTDMTEAEKATARGYKQLIDTLDKEIARKQKSRQYYQQLLDTLTGGSSDQDLQVDGIARKIEAHYMPAKKGEADAVHMGICQFAHLFEGWKKQPTIGTLAKALTKALGPSCINRSGDEVTRGYWCAPTPF